MRIACRVAAALLLCTSAALATAQDHPSSAQANSPPPASNPQLTPAPPGGKPLSQKQRDLQADTERLVVLAAELKASVDKSSKDQLSLDVVRKAEAVEKLAKSVKERMRESR